MKKICFNDKLRLTQKFLAGELSLFWDKVIDPDGKEWVKEDGGRYWIFSDGEMTHARFAEGDVVSVAMSYRDAGLSDEVFGASAGWKDKSQVNAKYMPHHIVIEKVRCLRVQDLTEEDVLRAGVKKNRGGLYLVGGVVGGAEEDWRIMLRKMFDYRSKVPYALNPWIIVYEFTPLIVKAQPEEE